MNGTFYQYVIRGATRRFMRGGGSNFKNTFKTKLNSSLMCFSQCRGSGPFFLRIRIRGSSFQNPDLDPGDPKRRDPDPT